MIRRGRNKKVKRRHGSRKSWNKWTAENKIMMRRMWRRTKEGTEEENPRESRSGITGGSWLPCDVPYLFPNLWESSLSHIIICFGELSKEPPVKVSCWGELPQIQNNTCIFKIEKHESRLRPDVVQQCECLGRQYKVPPSWNQDRSSGGIFSRRLALPPEDKGWGDVWGRGSFANSW